MAKTIGIKLALKDQFTSPLQKATQNVRTMDREMKKLKNRVASVGNSIKNGMKKIAKFSAVGLAGVSAGAIAFSKSSIDAAKNQIEQETKLQAVLKNTKGMRDDQIEGLKKYTAELQKIGVIGDSVTIAGLQQLGSYQLQAESLKKLMPGMNDLLAQQKGLNATEGDAVNIGNMLGKVMTGQVGALSRAGINFSKAQEKVLKFGTEQQKAAILADVLRQNVGGVNKALAETDDGKIKKMTNNWSDMKEELGKKLLPHLGNLAGWFNTKIPMIQNLILSTADKIQELVIKARPHIENVKEILGSIFDKVKPIATEFFNFIIDGATLAIDIAKKIKDNWDRLSPAIYTLVGGVTAYKTVMFISNNLLLIHIARLKLLKAWTVIQELWTGKLTIKQLALNVAMSTNPIGLVITAITVLVGAIWMLWKNWDVVTKAVKNLWAKLEKHPFGRLVKNILRVVFPVISVIENFDILKETFFKVVDFIKNVFLGAWDLLKKGIEAILKPIETIKEGFSSLMDKVRFWNKTEIKDKKFTITENEIKNTSDKSTKQKTSYSLVPRHALGTSYFQGGITGINEGGRNETAILPAGTKILSHEQSKKEKSVNLTFNLTVQGNLIGNRDFMEKCGQYITNKILLNIANT